MADYGAGESNALSGKGAVMRWLILWICRIHRGKLLKQTDKPFDAAVSQELDAIDQFIEAMEMLGNGEPTD